MPERIDAKLRQFLSNLVSTKHTDLLEMLIGKHEIVQFFSGFGDFLTLHETRLIAAHQTTNPAVAILEYEGIGRATQTGRPYLQKYITVLTFVKDGPLIGRTIGIRSVFLTRPVSPVPRLRQR